MLSTHSPPICRVATMRRFHAGADFLAVVTAVWNCPEGPASTIKAFNQAIAEHSDAGRR